ncbi:MAG TPA: cupin domain-containing protein [Trebonia sp.]
MIIRGHGEDCGRGVGEPGVSGPSSGNPVLRLHLVMIPPGTRGEPHFHDGGETAVYVVSGEADVWHGSGLGQRSPVRAGDFVIIPPGAPHLAVNRGEVTSIAVVAHTDPADQADPVVIELPRHLTALLSYPVAVGE